MKKLALVSLLLLLLMTAVVAAAQVSTRYDLGWHVLSGGGGSRSSAAFQIDDVLGQWADGRARSDQYQLDPGYWHSGREVQPRVLYLPVVANREP